MNNVDKEVALTTIATIMKDYNIDASELPSVKDSLLETAEKLKIEKQKFSELSDIAKTMYDKFIQEMGIAGAYDWASEHISSPWRDALCMQKPKTFKIIDVSMEFSLAVPQNMSEDSLFDYIRSYISEYDYRLCCRDDDIAESSLSNYNYSNTITDFTDEDF